MSDAGDNAALRDSARRLTDAIRDVKNAAADRADVVVDLRDAERMRLELLVTELQPVFTDVPHDVDLFDFSVSSGLQPRLWIDAVSHVAMGRDKRTYRFVRDTRAGRVVLAESPDMRPVADQVTRYIAERLVERQRMLDGVPLGGDVPPAEDAANDDAPGRDGKTRVSPWPRFFAGLYLVCSGVLIAVLAGLLYLLWGRLDVLLETLPKLG
jgi:hypothetical protein